MITPTLPDGAYSLQIELGAPEAGPYALELIATLLRAVELGCYGATTLAALQPPALTTPTLASAELQVIDSPRALWRVLGGMVEFYRAQGLPFTSVRLLASGFLLDPTQVQERDDPPRELSFRVLGRLPEWGRPLCMLIDFKRPVPKDARAELFDLFALWSVLVCGGYPADGAVLGESSVSGIAVRFLEPQLLEFSAERCHLGERALAPLLRGLSRLHGTLELEAIETT